MTQGFLRTMGRLAVQSVAPASFRAAAPFVATVALTACLGEARADIIHVQVSRTLSYVQTADGQVEPQAGTFGQFFASANLGASGDYTQATLTPPGSSTPIDMTLFDLFGTTQANAGQTFLSQAAMDAAFPLGVYTFEASGPAGVATATLDNAAHFYPGAPVLTGTNYSDLLSLDPTADFTLQWDPIAPGPATLSWIALTIFDQTDSSAPVAVSESLDGDATSYQIAADALRAGHEYILVLNLQNVLDGDGTRQVYSQETRVNFTVNVVPEPGSLALTALGLVGAGASLAMRARRRR